MKYITKEVRIGIAGIIALCVLVYGINWLKGIHMFQPSSYFYAKFQNVNGLTKSSPVFADGVRVGIVRDIFYDYTNPGNVVVEVELDTELRIPKGSSAELVSELMGGVRMNILLANNPREKYAVGDTIPGTLNNGMMESVAKLMPQVQEMLPKLDSILISLNTILGDKSIPATLHSIEKTTANLAVVSSQVKGLMSNDIPQLTSKLNTIGDNFVTISGNLKEVDYAATFKKIDETLALLVCVKTFDKLGLSRNGILGITMPGFGTTDRTYHNAIDLMKSLGISIREISIKDACIQHFKDIEHDMNVHDVTYENSQARERTQILMDVANQTWGMVIGTGDLSELALGWATYNGDHMSMYGVNASVPKTLVKYLVQWVAENGMDENSKATLLDIVDTPISPELIPADENGEIKQKTEDLVGPYELHDFFLYYFLRFAFQACQFSHSCIFPYFGGAKIG